MRNLNARNEMSGVGENREMQSIETRTRALS